MRVATAALDEAADWLAYREATRDEQMGEADALRRVRDASSALKARLSVYVLDRGADESS
jgi:hypothetical protein